LRTVGARDSVLQEDAIADDTAARTALIARSGTAPVRPKLNDSTSESVVGPRGRQIVGVSLATGKAEIEIVIVLCGSVGRVGDRHRQLTRRPPVRGRQSGTHPCARDRVAVGVTEAVISKRLGYLVARVPGRGDDLRIITEGEIGRE